MRNSEARAPGSSSVKALKALASPVRLAVLEDLKDPVAHFPPQVDGDPIADGICADFLRERLGLAAATASRHLAVLVEAGFLVPTRKKGWTFYRRNEGRIAAFAAALQGELGRAADFLEYVHADVFSPRPYSGNSLAVFPRSGTLSAGQMLRITQELRHFETIFLEPASEPNRVRARVFDLVEELPFAGHPLLGAAAVLHRRSGSDRPQLWQFELAEKTVTVTTEPSAGGYRALLDQGRPEFLGTVDDRAPFAEAFGLSPADLHPGLPLQAVSTGLRYLVIPVRPGSLDRARVVRDLTPLLRGTEAQYAVLFDEAALEIRHWNNDGVLEDVATGSAAGVIGAYRLRNRLAEPDAVFLLTQGRFLGRASVLRVQPAGSPEEPAAVRVGGDVSIVGSGRLEAMP